jgi:hypothetical protein
MFSKKAPEVVINTNPTNASILKFIRTGMASLRSVRDGFVAGTPGRLILGAFCSFQDVVNAAQV